MSREFSITRPTDWDSYALARAIDHEERVHLDKYNSAIAPLGEKAHSLFQNLSRGQDSETDTALPDDQVVPTLNAYVDAVIEKDEAKVRTPYSDEDLKQATQELARFRQIKVSGNDGLVALCQTVIDSFPRDGWDKSKNQIAESWKPQAEKWQHYQSIVRKSVKP